MRLTSLCLILLATTACNLALDGEGNPIITGNTGPIGVATPHPCFGNRTDALWIDDADTIYVGCGTTLEGTGLYRTTNAGGSWSAVAGFEGFRVDHINRASDGVLYVAGIGSNGDRVVSLDSSDTRRPVFVSGNQIWNNIQVGTFLRLDDGRSIAESLTGSDLAFRSADTADWEDGYGWWTADESFQILDAVIYQGKIAAVGSTIIQPPKFFLQTDDPRFEMSDTTLGSDDGELWSLDTDGTGLIAGGVNQNTNVGVVYSTTGDPTDPSAWKSYELNALWPDDTTWVRGVCRTGDHLIAVGELSTLGDGLMIESTDGGQSWSDVTPTGAPPLSRCQFASGRLVVAGAQGYFAISD